MRKRGRFKKAGIVFIVLFSSIVVFQLPFVPASPSSFPLIGTRVVEATSSLPTPGQKTDELFQQLANEGKISPQEYQALQQDPVQGITVSAIAFVVQVVNQILGAIAGILIWIGGQLISFAFNLNNYIMVMPVVLTGWKITRDIANLGFTLALIIIAFMTILRINQYGAQKMLPKLIAAAILVNFSLAIGGAILDFTNVITKFFVDRSISNSSQVFQIGDQLVAAFQPQALLNVDSQSVQKIKQNNPGLGTALTSVVSTFFIAAFTFLMALTLLAIALMLLSRFVWLAFLMAIAPIPWLFSVIPIGEVKKQGGNWWGKFIHWAFVAPILSFFLYLTMATVTAINTLANTIVSQNPNSNTNPTFMVNPILQITNMLILVGFLVGALLAANSMGIAGASAVTGFAKKTGEKARGWIGKQTVGKAGEGMKRGWNSVLTAGSKGDTKGRTWLERAGEGNLSKIPLLGAALTGMAGVSRDAKKRIEKTVDEGYDSDKKHSKEALANKLNRQLTTSQGDLGSALALAEKGGLGLLDEKKKKQLVDMVRKTGMQDKFAAYDPVIAAMAGDETKSFGERMTKYVGKVQDVSKLDPDVIRQSARYFRQGQMTQLGLNGTAEQKEAFETGLKETFVPKIFTEEGRKEAAKGKPEAATRYQTIEESFTELDKAEADLDSNMKKFKDAKDGGLEEEMDRLVTERKGIGDKIKKMSSDFLARPEGLSDEDYKERQHALNLRSSARKQIAWQSYYGTGETMETEEGAMLGSTTVDDEASGISSRRKKKEPLIKVANEYTDLRNVKPEK